MMNLETYNLLAQGANGRMALPERALFRLQGSDRVRYLNGQITNDVSKLKTGQAFYGAVLTGKGKLISDLFVAAGEDSLWIDTPLSLRTIAYQRLEKFLIADDAMLEDLTESHTLSHYWGSQPSSLELCFQNSRFGLPGFDVWQESENLSTPPHFPLVDPFVAETFRIEYSIPQWGTELDETVLPQEALFERNGLSYDKGCYVGQETVARIRSIGHVNRQLACIEFLEGTPPQLPSKLLKEGVEAGKLTSLTFSPLVEKTIGLGFVSRKFNHIGEDLAFETGRLRIIEPLRKLS